MHSEHGSEFLGYLLGMGMNPAIILLSLSIWGTLLGFMGLIIALPMTSLLLSYYNTYIVQRYDRHN